MEWKKIPSPFYRVSVKVLVFDEQQRLLMGRAPDSTWEPPGGGLEHGETLEQCLQRELLEELGVELASIGRPVVFYRGVNIRGFRALKIAVEATLARNDFKFADLVEARYVTKDELLGLAMSTDERGLKDYVDQIWPARNKS